MFINPHLALTCRMMEHKCDELGAKCDELGAKYTEKSGDPLGCAKRAKQRHPCINNCPVNALLHETNPETNKPPDHTKTREDLLSFELYLEANDVGNKKK